MKQVATFQDRFAELVSGETGLQVATRIDVSKTAVSAYLNGKREPKRPVLNNISRVYKVDPLWLMGYDVPKYKEAPDLSDEGISAEKKRLLRAVLDMDDETIRAVQSIVDQVLSLRDKAPDPTHPE